MWHTLKRILFEGGRPIDYTMLVIESLVLALIAYEVLIGIKERCAKKRRHSALDKRVSEVSTIIAKGQHLQSTVPDIVANYRENEVIEGQWIEAVRIWTDETSTLLMAYSARAVSAFLQLTPDVGMDNTIFLPGRTFPLSGSLRYCYQGLVAKLGNLHRIVERPDAYF
jgi:hypothetical protein